MPTGREHAPPHDADADAGRPRAGTGAGASEAPSDDLLEALRQIGATGRASLGASVDTAKAFRTLVVADVSLARSAMGRTLALSGVAIAAGASAWLLLMTALVVYLRGAAQVSWLVALLLPALLSLVVAGVACWQAMRYFDHTRLQATRRQLARLGIGELADFVPDPDSPASTREATRGHPTEASNGKPLKDDQGIDVTPP
ncbi:phage holin family protein [Novilysobacter arseniciresistens]|uniref:phage holin family protein n=1 Tax=Novilysobacter arseniciresistens TaxID=1385522 RepID=UPI000A9C8CC5|nr:phage holin family protein [Lysobacter arseniciresistens]